MRLIGARFRGFRLLENISIDFSVDPERNITVVRAANESGKTTMLTALQWCLFGDEALPPGYTTFSVDLKAGEAAETVCEVLYEVQGRNGTSRFRLVRSVSGQIGSQVRAKSNAQLYEVKPSGPDPVPNVDSYLAVHIPSDLREVFFTDGDKAMSFIEGQRAEQQKRVKQAIEQMMGLPMLEKAAGHVKDVERDVRKRAEDAAGNEQLKAIGHQIADLDALIPKLEEKGRVLADEIANLNGNHERADRELQAALERGNREEIAEELRLVKKQREQAETRERNAEFQQAALLSNQTLAYEMLAGPLAKATGILEELRNKGVIPRKTIPLLEDRLQQKNCICGGSLDAQDPEGKVRRDHIEQLIEESREADALMEKVSDLFHDGRAVLTKPAQSWRDLYEGAYAARSTERSNRDELGKREADLEVRLDKVKDDNVQRAREMRDTYRKQLDDKVPEATRLSIEIRGHIERRNELNKKFDALSAREDKAHRFRCELSAAQDIRRVLEGALEKMKTREVRAVSERMNVLFLRMIGAHPDDALYQRAEITPEFRIAVFGRNDRQYDPSTDVNGASRRALTIAFILALTEVSGVEAPNVIDTPLGMMSGFVKNEVLKVASESSSQLILFLTHDEINGCETILDAKAGSVTTISNPLHYPRILKNDPGTTAAAALQCACDHRSSCEVCERIVTSNDAVVEEAM